MLVGGDARRVERVDVGGEPVDDRLVLALERAEEAVPHDEDAAVVAVDVAAVAAVVDPVVRGRVEHLLRPAQLADRLGVDPELVEEVDAPGRLDQLRAGTRPAPSGCRARTCRRRRPPAAAMRSTGCSARSSGARRGWPTAIGSRAWPGGSSSRRSPRPRWRRRRPAHRRRGRGGARGGPTRRATAVRVAQVVAAAVTPAATVVTAADPAMRRAARPRRAARERRRGRGRIAGRLVRLGGHRRPRGRRRRRGQGARRPRPPPPGAPPGRRRSRRRRRRRRPPRGLSPATLARGDRGRAAWTSTSGVSRLATPIDRLASVSRRS